LTDVVSPSVVALVEKTMRSFFLLKLKIAVPAILLGVVLAGSTTAALFDLQRTEQPGPSPRPAIQPAVGKDRTEPAKLPAFKAETLARWSRSEVVVIGRFVSAQGGPVGLSQPPVYTHRLEVRIDKVLRGSAKAGERIKASHSVRQQNAPEFPTDKDLIIGLAKIRGAWQLMAYEESTAKALAEVKAATSVPVGWTVKNGKLVSPWAGLGKTAWPAAARGKGPFVCSVTGRPARMAGNVDFTLEVVPPKVKLKYGNPDGDGEFKLTVKNSTDKAVTVPALLSDGKNILWKESLVILCQDKTYTIPGSKGVSAPAKPVVLKPGESVSTTVNALALKGPEWPRGGYRIEFLFALGEKSVTQSFYYLSRHHDPIRDRAQAGK
jgi:hypothetical protein